MEYPSKFSLFKLPLIATEHVLRMLNPFELIDLSLTSTRARKLVSYFYKFRVHEKFRVTLRITGTPHVTLYGPRTSYFFKLTSDKSKEGLKNIYDSSAYYCQHLNKYSEDVIQGLLRCYEYLNKVFECKIGTFDINTSLFENRLIIDWLKKQQETIDEVLISNFINEKEDDVKYILNNIKVTKELFLDLSSVHGTGFQFDLSENVEILRIFQSFFLTLESLLKLKSRQIDLYESSLTSRELNMFLKSWMSCESHLNLETFQVTINDREAMKEILDLPHEKISDPDVIANVRNLCRKRSYWEENVTDVYEIKRSDGKVANVCLVLSNSTYYWRMHLIIR